VPRSSARLKIELTALVARKHSQRYGRFAARRLCLYLEEHEKATLEDAALLVSNLQSLLNPRDHTPALAILRKAARPVDHRGGRVQKSH
jgi:hypothetical protein